MLNINELFDLAIANEQEAYAFYSDAAQKVTNPGVRDIFLELAREENGHAMILEKFKATGVLANRFMQPEVDYKIAETQEPQVLSTSMKPADAIALAMKREQEAAAFYQMLAARASDATEQAALISLANMELEHKQKLENLFVEIGYPEVF